VACWVAWLTQSITPNLNYGLRSLRWLKNRLRIDLIKVLHCGHAAVGLDFDNGSAADRSNHYIGLRIGLFEVSSFRRISKEKTIISDPLFVGSSLTSRATDISLMQISK